MKYDADGTLRENTYFKEGYHQKEGAEWNTKADGSGISYSSGQVVRNLTDQQDGNITLYANISSLTLVSMEKRNNARFYSLP